MRFSTILVSALSVLPYSILASSVEERACIGPNVNDATINMIKGFEGFVPRPKPDPVGYPTVGYGHKCRTKNCRGDGLRFPLSKAAATELLKKDLKAPQQTITLATTTRVKLNANQYGALVSWAFNVGPGPVRASTLMKRLNAGQNVNTVIGQELPKWIYADGHVLPGLVRRRAAEVKLAHTPTKVPALPVKC